MEIKSNFASLAYASARTELKPTPVGGTSATSAISQLTASFVDTLRQGETVAKAGMVGGADALSVVEALAASEIAIETAVSVRDKVVEAYQEILRMPV